MKNLGKVFDGAIPISQEESGAGRDFFGGCKTRWEKKGRWEVEHGTL
jgi:hypothetical protein